MSGEQRIRTESLRRMGPLAADHPMVVDDDNPLSTCPACRKRFAAGEYVTLIPLGPGDDPEARASHRAKRAYNAVAMPVHWACATGEES